MPEKTVNKQDTRFKPGESGNPDGRPKGDRNKATIAAESLLAGEADELTRKVIEMAKAGDRVALRICMERVYPKPRYSPVDIDLPKINNAEDIPKVLGEIFLMVGEGRLTPDVAKILSGIVNDHGKAIELSDLEKRIKALEDSR